MFRKDKQMLLNKLMKAKSTVQEVPGLHKAIRIIQEIPPEDGRPTPLEFAEDVLEDSKRYTREPGGLRDNFESALSGLIVEHRTAIEVLKAFYPYRGNVSGQVAEVAERLIGVRQESTADTQEPAQDSQEPNIDDAIGEAIRGIFSILGVIPHE